MTKTRRWPRPRGNPAWMLTMALAASACASSSVTFGGLKADRRSLSVKTDVELLQLTSGMVVALAPDNRTNLVSVDMRYRVGAADDVTARAGMAHLVEHLTFAVAGNADGGSIYDELETRTLAFNAFTDQDVTHYTATALANQLPRLLELEARRLEGGCAKIPEAVFVRERDVVLEEEAQRTTPWMALMGEVRRAVWGPDHPYARAVGSRAIAAATQAQACAFFEAHYAPQHAILVVSGNFDPKIIRSTIGHRFGPITHAGTATARPRPASLTGTRSEHVGDVDHPVALIYLPAPAWGDADEALHDLVMTAYRTELSELDDRAAWVRSTSVSYDGVGYQRVAVVAIEVDSVDRLDQAVDQALRAGRDVLQDDDRDGNADDSDDADDLDVAHYLAALRGRQQTQTITWADQFEGHGLLLANYLTYASDYDFALARMRATDAITGTAATRYAKQLFRRERSHVAVLIPSGRPGEQRLSAVAASAQEYDLAPWRAPADPAEADRPIALAGAVPAPDVLDIRLTNGLRVLMYAEPKSTAFSARIVFPTGAAAEPGDQPGVAKMAAELIQHDFHARYGRREVDIINWAMRLGTQLTADVDDDVSVLSSRGLSLFGDWHLWRLAWLLDKGVYDPAALAATRKDLLEGTERPTAPWLRLLLQQVYGGQHPYAAPRATRAQRAALTTGQLTAWRNRVLTPTGATLIVSGGFDPVIMRKHIADLFGGISKSSATRPPAPPPARPGPGPTWIGVRTKGDAQVGLFISIASTSDRIRDRAARSVLAALVSDRLRGIRESMGATYGVSADYDARAAGSTLDIGGSLDPARAPKAAAAILASLAALRDDPQSAAADFVRARKRLLGLALASSIDATDVAARLEQAVRAGSDPLATSDDARAIAALTLADVARVATADLDPARMVVSLRGRFEPVRDTLAATPATGIRWFDE